MKIPKGMTEEQVLEIIDNVARRLRNKFKFGYHGAEDMEQQARLFALQVLPKYDNERPLENFLWSCVHNKLYNYKRDNFERPGYACETCPFKAWIKDTDKCTKYDHKLECNHYNVWYNRNTSKRNIMNPIGISNVQDEHERNMRTDDTLFDNITAYELDAMIEDKLPMEMRTDYIKFKNGINVPKQQRDVLISTIRKIILKDNNEDR